MSHQNVSPVVALFPLALLLFIVVLFVYYARNKGYSKIGGDNVIVRCRSGHLFTTIWIPGISLKAIRLGLIRYQFCPVGQHWAFVDLVNEADLTDAEREFAYRHHDKRIP